MKVLDLFMENIDKLAEKLAYPKLNQSPQKIEEIELVNDYGEHMKGRDHHRVIQEVLNELIKEHNKRI